MKHRNGFELKSTTPLVGEKVVVGGFDLKLGTPPEGEVVTLRVGEGE